MGNRVPPWKVKTQKGIYHGESYMSLPCEVVVFRLNFEDPVYVR